MFSCTFLWHNFLQVAWSIVIYSNMTKITKAKNYASKNKLTNQIIHWSAYICRKSPCWFYQYENSLILKRKDLFAVFIYFRTTIIELVFEEKSIRRYSGTILVVCRTQGAQLYSLQFVVVVENSILFPKHFFWYLSMFRVQCSIRVNEY